jgi:hypothetical protein
MFSTYTLRAGSEVETSGVKNAINAKLGKWDAFITSICFCFV